MGKEVAVTVINHVKHVLVRHMKAALLVMQVTSNKAKLSVSQNVKRAR